MTLKLWLTTIFLIISTNNLLAYTDEEFDMYISKTTGYLKQAIKCEKVANNHHKDGDVNECVKAVKMLEESKDLKAKELLGSISQNTAGIYYFGQNNIIRGYEYWYKGAKYGDITSQENLELLCKEYPWACK